MVKIMLYRDTIFMSPITGTRSRRTVTGCASRLRHLPTELPSSRNSGLVRGSLSDGLPGGFRLRWSKRPRCSSDKARSGRDQKARQTRFSESWVRPRRRRALSHRHRRHRRSLHSASLYAISLFYEEASEAVLSAPPTIGSVPVAITTSRRFPKL